MGLERTSDPLRCKNNSGDSEATAPQAPDTKAARAGAVWVIASVKKSTGSPVNAPRNCVHTQAWYTSPAAMASRQRPTAVR
ncbi:Uncharacterised protein [Mycobacteroides abscessus subsp. massiliense]|nr:Uncharacterised protein [Mycobacteroides abscessus subsp. massiliense]